MSFLELELESSNAPLLVKGRCRSRWSLVFRCSGTKWLHSSVVQRVYLHPVEKNLFLGSVIYRVENGEESKISRKEWPMAYLSGRVLQSACALIPSCSDPTSNGQISVYKWHPWIGNADTHSTWRIYNKVQSHPYCIKYLKRELTTIIWPKAI